MLVDPNTGEIIDSGPSFGQSFAAQTAQNAMANADMQNSRLYEAAEYMPGALQTMGWNTWRGSNTVLSGLKSRRPWRVGSKPMGHGIFKGGIPSTFHPSNFNRMPTYNTLHPFDGMPNKGAAGYTPFQFLARVGNEGVGPIKGAKHMVNKAVKASLESGTSNPLLKKLMAHDIISPVEVGKIGQGADVPDMYSGAFFSRMTASGRLARAGSKTLNSSRRTGVMNFLGGTDKGLHTAINVRGFMGEIPDMSGHDAMHYVLSSQKGRLSQFAGGYLGGARAGLGDAVAGTLEQAGGREAYMAGARLATKHLGAAGIEHAGGKLVAVKGGELVERGILKAGQRAGFGALGRLAMTEGGSKLATKAGLAMAARVGTSAIPVVGQVILALQTAYDLGKMGIAVMKGGAEFAKDAYKSFQGSLYKPTMGMGYRDTEVAATSRSRGVMAIQNSRLNARSILGSEAAGMHAHFG
jgi:hypothetical protein